MSDTEVRYENSTPVRLSSRSCCCAVGRHLLPITGILGSPKCRRSGTMPRLRTGPRR